MTKGRDADCAWRLGRHKLEDHLFCKCDFAGEIWYRIYSLGWNGCYFAGNIIFLLDCFSSSPWSKKTSKMSHAHLAHNFMEDSVARNGVIFYSKNKRVEDLVDNIKVAS